MKDGFAQVCLVNGRSIDEQFIILSILILEDGIQDAGRLPFAFLGDVNHGVTIEYGFLGKGIRSIDLREIILVVGTIVIRRKLLASQRTSDDEFRIILQRIVHFIVDFIHDAPIKDDCPS